MWLGARYIAWRVMLHARSIGALIQSHVPVLTLILYCSPLILLFLFVSNYIPKLSTSMSMKAYLAAKYMSGPKADAILSRTGDTTKKKKRKTGSSTPSGSGLIKDDDLLGWGDAPKEDAEEEEVVVASDRGFKKRQRTDESSGWATIREPTPPPAADEQPQVVMDESMQEGETPFQGGLLTSAQLKKRLPKKATQKEEMSKEEVTQAQETIYRDSSGRKVDVTVERAEAARRKREVEEREARKMEWGKGLVQREDQEKRRKELDSMKNAPFARTADDTTLNEELKAEDRWNDPAAAFLTVCGSVLSVLESH